ncbi:hypothetical protein JNM05_16055 [bacterium]|nr:hypothetical protein [bacterium]
MKKVKDVVDPISEYKRLSQKLSNNFNATNVLYTKYSNKIGGFASSQNSEANSLLNAFRYRHDCILFHLKCMLNLQLVAEKQYKSLSNDSDRIMFAVSVVPEFSGLFDSIIFHSVSGFDYCAHLIDFICNNRLNKDRKWAGIIEAAKNKSIDFNKSSVATLLVKLDDEFIKFLKLRRNQVIHYEPDTATSSSLTNLRTHQNSLEVIAPRQMIDKIPSLKIMSETHELTMVFASCWMIDRVYDLYADIIAELVNHVDHNRKTISGHTFFRDNNGNFHEI